MRRITAFFACLIVGIDCARTAAGHVPQQIFGADAVWLWWIVSAAWLTSGFRILIGGAA